MTVALATGLTYAVRRWGATVSPAPPIVLVHGFLDLAATWNVVAPRLASALPDRTIIAPDLRGHGDSDRVGVGGYYHFFDYVADLDALLDALALPVVDLVGHSMGGMVCGYYAGTRPERVRRLALLEGMGPPEPPRDGDALPTRTRAWLDGWRRARTSPDKALASLDDAMARLRKHDPLLTDEAARAYAMVATRTMADGTLAWKHDPLHLTLGPVPFRRDHAEPFWRAITAPVLLVDGARSTVRLTDDDAATRRACLRDVTRQVLADAGHMMMRHQPTALADALAGFFR